MRAVRDGDQRPRPPRDLADRLAGRHRDRRVTHEGAHHRRPRRPHQGGARRGQRSCSSPASRASRTRLATSPRSAAAARTRPPSPSRRRSAPRSARSTPTSPACTRPTPGSCPTRASCRRVSFEEMLEMAASGAGVLQLRSVEYARNHGVRIHCRSSFDDAPGTVVRRRGRNDGATADHSRDALDRPRRASRCSACPTSPARPRGSSRRSPTRTSTST